MACIDNPDALKLPCWTGDYTQLGLVSDAIGLVGGGGGRRATCCVWRHEVLLLLRPFHPPVTPGCCQDLLTCRAWRSCCVRST